MDLVFAPDNGYFLIHPKGRKWRGVPQVFSAKFQDGAPDRVANVHCVSFGEGGAFFMSWTDTHGKIWKWANFKGKYPGLKAWLDDASKGHKSQNLFIVLGPEGSCYGLSRGVGWYRNGLAQALNDKLDALRDGGKSVRHLQLGVEGSYWVEGTDGSRSWNLKGNYPNLQEYVKDHKFTNVSSLNLSPFNDHHYFMVFKHSSSARWNLPSTWAPDIRQVATQYQHANASTNGGTGTTTPSSSHHYASSSHHRSSDTMSEISSGLEMTEKIAKTAGAVISTTAMVAGTGCLLM